MNKPSLLLLWLLSTVLGFTTFAQPSTPFIVIMSPIEGTLDPAFNSNDPDTAFSRALFDYFIEPLPDGNLAPNIASQWEISDDGLTYTFDIVEDIFFHDGTPLTAADVVWTYNRLRNPDMGSPASNLLTDIDTVEAPDDYTVVFTLKRPNAELLLNLASRWSLVVKANTTDFSAGNISNVGSGPFILESYLPGLDAIFQANPDYWKDDGPNIDTLIFRYEPNPQLQVEALLAQEAHFAFKIPVELTTELEAADYHSGYSEGNQSTSGYPSSHRHRTGTG